MKTLDEALIELRQSSNDVKKQSQYYDLFLNSSFFVPIAGDSEAQEEAAEQGATDVVPVVIEAEGNDYLMLFSSLERLREWSNNDESLRFIEVPGHVLAQTSTEPLHWALNAGTEFSKRFYPTEIDWLRQAVEHCNAEAAKAHENCCG